MEILILGGLSILGYNLSKFERKTSIQKPHFEVREPQSVNIVPEIKHSNMVPFYKSLKSQNTNDNVKDRRLATFTGVGNMEFTKKKETLHAPMESQITHPNGVTFQPDIDRYKDYIVNNKHNNVSPVVKQYIGPGLGTDKGSDQGFHSTFRILPDNINVYRKNNLSGSVNHGKSSVDNRSILPGDTTTSRRNLKTDKNEYINGVMSSVSAMTNRSEVHLPSQQSYGCQPPTGPVSQTSGHLLNSQIVNPKHERTTECNISGNPSNQSSHRMIPHFLVHDNERDNPNCHILNTQLPTASTNPRYDHYDNTTLRDNPNCQLLNFASNTNVSYNHNIKNTPTQRGSCNQPSTQNHPSYSGSMNNSITKTNITTQRGMENCYTSIPYYNGGSDYTNAYSSEPNKSREYAILTGRTPNGERSNINLDKSQINMDVKNDCNKVTNLGGVHAKGLQNFASSNERPLSTSKATNPTNNRQFGFVPKNNPLAISITH